MPVARRALVFGIGDYPGDFHLESPDKDAGAVASALTKLNFQVSSGIDAAYDTMNALVDAFVKAVETERPQVTLFYYSGHGLQIEEQNYLVPVDFDSAEKLKLVPVQDIIDRICGCSGQLIVLLDACRSNFDSAHVLRGEGINTPSNKSIYVGGVEEQATGLAEMNASNSTFIAFAAAPGDVAYDGEGALSPFTQAFLDYVDVVDLPLSNLMSRVRQRVLAETGGRQRTWDQSSLMAPFYFNPGSMFLFMGNALALAGLIAALVPYSYILTVPNISWPWIAVSALLPLISLLILMFGMQTAYGKLRGDFQAAGGTPTLREQLMQSLGKGVLGGYLSSIVAGLGITYLYYRTWVGDYRVCKAAWAVRPSIRCMNPPEPFGQIAVEIAVAAALVACVLGVLSLTFARVGIGRGGFVLAGNRSPVRILTGTIFGGAVAGILTASLLMLHFGKLHRPMVTPDLLLPGSVLGTAVIVFAIVNFDFERLDPRRLLVGAAASLVSIVAGFLASGLLFGLLFYSGIQDALINWIGKDALSDPRLLVGGAVYGLPVGVVLGLMIGITMILTERWSGKPVFWHNAG